MNFRQEIQQRKTLLETIKHDIEKQKPPKEQGKIRGVAHQGYYQYYLRKSTKDKNGTYIPKREMSKIKQLVQWEYQQDLLSRIQKELEMLEQVELQMSREPWDMALIDLPQSKRVLVESPVLSDEAYAAEWSAEEYPHKEFNPDRPVYHSARGEQMRSKSEVLIADALYAAGIPYHYEKPLRIKKRITFHPDFTILHPTTRREYIWEHLGMMENFDYRNDAFQRIRDYEEEGFFLGNNLLVTFETPNYPLNPRTVRRMIHQIFCP